MSGHPLPRQSSKSRWAAAVGALITSTGLLTALVGAFSSVSSQPWLQPTPEVLELAAACKAKPARAEQAACLRQLVAQRSAVPSRDARLATTAPTRAWAPDDGTNQ